LPSFKISDFPSDFEIRASDFERKGPRENNVSNWRARHRRRNQGLTPPAQGRSIVIQIRKAADRGHFDHGWLETYHTFSFGEYYDPAQMGFRALRVINDDRVQPEMGFGMHGHRDMEIVTYVLEGALEHRDSMGHGAVLRPGELQHMSAGTGIRHSEFNPSDQDLVHLYQIWLLPERNGLAPSYEQKAFPEDERRGRLRLVASPTGEDGSLTIRQDARLYLATLRAGESVIHSLAAGRHAWLQLLRGEATLNQNHEIAAGDGVAVSAETMLETTGRTEAEILLFDLA
jgi:redox-sensitive bicupin YhaK (pirin superfamily)